MMSKRQFNRHRKRLETIFTPGTERYSGITSDVSGGGLFIRTRNPFAPGSILDIEIYLPDGKTSKLKGRVKRAIKTQIAAIKNGMGIELLEKDSNYINFVKEIKDSENRATASNAGKSHEPLPAHLIIACANCRAKNKVAREKLSLNPRCGKCGTSLRAEDIV